MQRVLLTTALMLAAVGCSSGPKKVAVAGSVSYDGKSVEDGRILFLPAEGVGAPEGGPITDGRFSCQVTPGRKRIEITGFRDIKGTANPMRNGLPDREDYIPEDFNTKSTLTEEVPEKGKADFEFTLQKSKK